MRLTICCETNNWSLEGPSKKIDFIEISKNGLKTGGLGPLTQGSWTAAISFRQLKEMLDRTIPVVAALKTDNPPAQRVRVYGVLETGREVSFYRIGTTNEYRDPRRDTNDAGRSGLASLIVNYLEGQPVPFEMIEDYIKEKVTG